MRDALLLLTFCFLTYPKLLAQPSGASMEGTVVDSVSAAPLSGVHVHLELQNPDEVVAPVYGSVSNDAGRFSMAGIQPGVGYRLEAELPGYLLFPTVEQAPNGVILRSFKAGEHIQGYKLELARRAVITGRVLDENGDPAPGTPVVAQRVPRQQPTHAASLGFGASDDRGVFRLVVLPERYYLAATGSRDDEPAEIRTDGSVAPHYVSTYYPSAPNRESATVVEAQAGSSVSGIEIRMIRSAMLRISGVMSGYPPDAAGLTVVLHNDTGMVERVEYPKSDGKFSFGPLDAGTYKIYAQAATPAGPMRSAIAEVKLSTASIELGSLPVTRGFDVRGVLSGIAPAGRHVELVGVRTNDNIMPVHGGMGSISNDGSFTIKGVQPGQYELVISPLPEAGYVKSLRLGETEVEDSVIDLRRGSTSALLNVSVSEAGAQISGVLTDSNGQPLRRKGFVTAVLDGKDFAQRHRHGDETDGDGAFTLQGLPPGNYRVFATVYGITQYPADGAARNTALREWAANADVVEVHDGQKVAKNVKVVGAK